MLTCDYHLHTPLCHHATGWPIDYAHRARELGLTEIGFAEHSPFSGPFDDWRMALSDLPEYLARIEEARTATPEVTIRVGLEVDYLEGGEEWVAELAAMHEWDFLIGSVHYIAPGWAIDNPKFIGRFREEPVDQIWALYWRAYERCIRSRLFDWVAHPDLPKKFGFRPSGDLRRFYEPAIAALAETGTAYEINTAGLRKECRELYPASAFVELAHAAGVPVLINSDAHDPAELGAGFPEARELAFNAGYRQTVRFQRRQRTLVPL